MSAELRDQYDWVVLGDHPGALLSACLAAKLKLSTLVLPMSFTIPRFESKDHSSVLDYEPNYLIGMGSHAAGKGLLRACHEFLGGMQVPPGAGEGREDGPQVLTPDSRVRFSKDLKETTRELARELGVGGPTLGTTWSESLEASLDGVLDYWLKLPERLTLPQKDPAGAEKKNGRTTKPKLTREATSTASKAISATAGSWYSVRERLSGLDGRMGLLFQGLWSQIASAGHDEDPTLRDFFTLSCLSMTAAGFPGGMSAYRTTLLKMAERFGAHVRPGVDCSRVFFRGGQFSGIQVGGKGEMTTVVGGAIGCSLDQIGARVGQSSSGTLLASRLKAPFEPSGWTFTLSVSLKSQERGSGLPPGFTSPMIWKEPSAPTLSFEWVPGPERVGSTLYLRALMPQTKESLEPGFQRQMAARMLAQAAEVLPFLERSLIAVFPDFRGSADSKAPVNYLFGSLDKIPENLRVFSGVGLGAQSGIEGLFCVSSEAYPQLGSFGPTIAAIEAVAWLAHRSGLNGPFG